MPRVRFFVRYCTAASPASIYPVDYQIVAIARSFVLFRHPSRDSLPSDSRFLPGSLHSRSRRSSVACLAALQPLRPLPLGRCLIPDGSTAPITCFSGDFCVLLPRKPNHHEFAVERRCRILLTDFALLIAALLATALAPDMTTLHVSSFVIGVCSVVPQFFIPLAAQYSRPERKNRNVGIEPHQYDLYVQLLHRRIAGNAVFGCGLDAVWMAGRYRRRGTADLCLAGDHPFCATLRGPGRAGRTGERASGPGSAYSGPVEQIGFPTRRCSDPHAKKMTDWPDDRPIRR